MSARKSPVSPPRPNVNTNPSANSIGVVMRIAPRHSVPSQLTNRSAVGTEMIMVEHHEALAQQRAHAGGEHVVAVDDRRQHHDRR